MSAIPTCSPAAGSSRQTRSATFNGLYYYRARIYNPKLARFMQADPIGYVDSMNLYQYAFNSPTNYFDPWGLSSKGSLRDGLTSEERLKRDAILFLGNASAFLYHGIHIGLDVAGTFDPTPICDTIHTAGYLGEGRWGDAGLTAAGMIPFGGDSGKVLRYGDEAADALKAVDKAGDAARVFGKNVPKLPGNARTITKFDEVAKHLKTNHGIDPKLASERLHKIKNALGRGGADDVIFDYTGGVYDPVTREWLGSLTEGGAKSIQ